MFVRRHSRIASYPSCPVNRGVTLIELLVVFVILAILLALAIPAVQYARTIARRTQCQNNLHQVAIGLQNHHAQVGYLPKDGERGWGYGVFLLLHLGEHAVHSELEPLKQNQASLPPSKQHLLKTAIPLLRCPAFSGSHLTSESLGRSSYRASADVFGRRTELTDIYDGESNTFALGETVTDHSWPMPGTGTCDRPPNDGTSFGSEHAGGANFVMCDGAVRFIADEIDVRTFQALCSRAGREPIGDF